MLWGKNIQYLFEPFEKEEELENAIVEVSAALFGKKRVYLNEKKKIGAKNKTKNIPDGYLIDLSSSKNPQLYVAEVELAKHDPLKHIAVQILEFSLSFETSPYKVKSIIKDSIINNENAFSLCQEYALSNGYENLDVLLEHIIYGNDRFNALVVIDQLHEELEKVLISRFQFPVEIVTIERYKNKFNSEFLYKFEPFLGDIVGFDEIENGKPAYSSIDPSEIDTIVVPARDEGFEDVFMNENRWWAIRIHSSMIPKIKYIASYRVSPISAITHVAPVSSIEQWKDTNKYVVNFLETPQKIKPIKLVPKGFVKAPQGPRYTSKSKLDNARNLDEAF